MYFEDNDDVLGQAIERSHELQHSPRGTKWAPWAKDLVKQARAAGRTVNEMFGTYAERLAKYGGGAAAKVGGAVNKAANAAYGSTPEAKAHKNMKYHQMNATSKKAHEQGEYKKAAKYAEAANHVKNSGWNKSTKDAIAGTAASYKRTAKRKLKNFAEKVAKKANKAKNAATGTYNSAKSAVKKRMTQYNDAKRKRRSEKRHAQITPHTSRRTTELNRSADMQRHIGAENRKTAANKRRVEQANNQRAAAQEEQVRQQNAKKKIDANNRQRAHRAEYERSQAMDKIIGDSEDLRKARRRDAQYEESVAREIAVVGPQMAEGAIFDVGGKKYTKKNGKVIPYGKGVKHGIFIPGQTGTSDVILHDILASRRFRL